MGAFKETIAVAPFLRGKESNRESRQSTPQPLGGEEMLVVDARAHLTPAQMVDRKLIGLMKDLFVSCLRSAEWLRGR
jgi:hypothetical protein